MNIELDSYTRRARIAPVFVLILAVLFGVIPWVPGVLTLEFGAAAVIFTVGVPVLLSQLGGVLGKRGERRLWESWGGSPTTQLLRHRTSGGNPVMRGRWHSRLAELFPDVTLPSEAEESADPAAADDVYEACTKRLIALTRDQKKFGLLFVENAAYGFRRNLWGMKPLGVVLASAALSSCLARIALHAANKEAIPVAVVGCGAAAVVLLFIWLFVVTPKWVRERADAYSERLMEAVEVLEGPPSTKSKGTEKKG